MIEHLIKCDPKGNKHIKSIIRPERVVEANAHNARYINGFFQVNTDKVKFEGPYSPYIALDKLRINHYWTRDIYNLYNFKLPRMENLKANLMVAADNVWYLSKELAHKISASEWCLTIGQLINSTEDTCIHKYLSQLKKNMGII